MIKIDNKLIEMVNDRLNLIIEEAIFDERETKIFKYRYGIEGELLEPKVIAKTMKIPAKKLKVELERIDNKVFNILKKHDLFDLSV